MTTTTGTGIFRTIGHAERYYRPYGFTARNVKRKIDDEEISIDDSPAGIGHWNDEGRWVLTDVPRIAPTAIPPPPPIHFIVHTITSERDRNGNTYHLCTITDTRTRKSIRFESGGSGNGLHMLLNHLREQNQDPYAYYEIAETVPKRDWQRTERNGGPWLAEHVAKVAVGSLVSENGKG